MARKFKSGLPEDFDIEVENPDTPEEPGDYLDNIAQASKKEPASKKPESPLKEDAADIYEFTPPRKPSEKGKTTAKKKPPRKQVNMKPETLKQAESLLDIIREQGPQQDASASEMYEALTEMLYRAAEQLNLTNVPKRGRWGSQTSEEFITELTNSFIRAVKNL